MLLDNFIKYGLIVVTYKIWWPILKALWTELQGAMWREGGIIGREPTAAELVVLEEKYGHIVSPLINESFAEFKVREEQEEADRVAAKKQGSQGPQGVVQPAARRPSGSTGSTGAGFGGGAQRGFGSGGGASGGGARGPARPGRGQRGFGSRSQPRRGF